MVSLYDQALVTGHAKEQQWRDFAEDTRTFVNQNMKAVTESVTLPRGRRLQLKLMAISPTLYGVFSYFINVFIRNGASENEH